MNGNTLKTAAEIIVKAGIQIDALMELLEDLLIKAIENKESGIRADTWDDNTQSSDGDWLITNYLIDIRRLEKKKKRPFSHLAIEAVIYDENDVKIQGWEPALYVMHGFSEEPFDFEFSVSDALSDLLAGSCVLAGNHLWCWPESDENDESWLFAVPLVLLNSKRDLTYHIVNPVKKLIDTRIEELMASKGNPNGAFPDDSIVFRYAIEAGDKISITKGSAKKEK